MSTSKSSRPKTSLWGGGLIIVAGAVLVYFGLDYRHTNLATFVHPEYIAGALVIIGLVVIVIGVVSLLTASFGLGRRR